MAKQSGIIKITGTIDDITFYKMGDQYYARMKSSLTGKRFWKDKAFAGSRRSATALGQASRLASVLYHTLPKEQKGRPVFQKLTGRIKLMLQEGMDISAITVWFTLEYQSHILLQTQEEKSITGNTKKIYAYQPIVPQLHHSLIMLDPPHLKAGSDVYARESGTLIYHQLE